MKATHSDVLLPVKQYQISNNYLKSMKTKHADVISMNSVLLQRLI